MLAACPVLLVPPDPDVTSRFSEARQPWRSIPGRFAVTVLLALALSASHATAEGAAGDVEGPTRHLILISIDTLRPDHLGAHGYARPTSPNIDRLAAQGVVFLDATSTSPWTLPAHATMLTGLYPSRHGLKDHVNHLSDSVPSLATRLRREGYRTMALINSHNLSRQYGLDQGFERLHYFSEFDDPDATQRAIVNRGEEITDKAIQWLKKRDRRPFFLFVHYYDVHTDYGPRQEYRDLLVRPYSGPMTGATSQLGQLRREEKRIQPEDVRHLIDLYDGEIRQLDDTLAKLFGFLDKEALTDETLLVITSDHGEEFMEHGSYMHGRTHYQEVIAIPWIMRGPGLPSGLRIDWPVSLVDMVPTVLGLLGKPGEGFDGANLAPYLNDAGQRPDDRLLFSEADHKNVELDMYRMVRQGRFKLIYNRKTQELGLFDLEEDPGEQTSVDQQRSGLVLMLKKQLDGFSADQRDGERIPPPSPETLRLLKELGYAR
jgi:choline-sulfatase